MSRTVLLFFVLTASSWSQDRLPPRQSELPPTVRVEMLQPPPNSWLHFVETVFPSVVGALVALGVLLLANRHSQRMWDRQLRLTAKRERYERLLTELLGLRHRAGSISADLLGGPYSSGSAPDAEIHKLVDEWLVVEMSAKVSRLFVPKAVFEILSKAVGGFIPVYSAFTAVQDSNTGSPDLDDRIRSFGVLIDEFIIAAKTDLEIQD